MGKGRWGFLRARKIVSKKVVCTRKHLLRTLVSVHSKYREIESSSTRFRSDIGCISRVELFRPICTTRIGFCGNQRWVWTSLFAVLVREKVTAAGCAADWRVCYISMLKSFGDRTT